MYVLSSPGEGKSDEAPRPPGAKDADEEMHRLAKVRYKQLF